MRKVPKLRFKEFSDEWEEKKLGEICSIKTGKKDTKNKIENGIYPFFVRSQNVEKINTYSYDGEAILTAGDGVGVGKVFHYINGKFDFHQRVYKLSDFDQNYGRFIYEIFRKDFRKEVSKYNAKTSVDSIRLEMISNMKVTIPSLQEQEKIADFLSNVDKKISLTEEKLKLFREYKKGVMQKIFSQKLRFKDSEGNDYPEWEEKKLGEIAIFSKGRLISKEDISLNGVECIRYGELYTTYKEKIVDIVNKTNIDTDKLILSKKNDVIIPSSGETAIDIAVASCVMKDGVALGSDLNIIKTKENGLYLAYFINNPAKLELASLAQGASVIHLYEKHLKLLNIQLPILEEQQKIAAFLSSIDTKIENIEKELEGLKEFKKGLLQQMFV